MNYLKIFIRNQKKNKAISLINLTGLVIGILSALFILEYVYYERSYDRFHKKGDRIFRVAYDRYQYEKVQWKTANSYFPLGNWLKENYNEVEDWVTLSRKYNITVGCENALGDKVFFNEAKAYYSTNSIFNVFTIPRIEGSQTCLAEPWTVALSEHAAKRYFGKVSPIGKTITVNGTENYTVTAVYEDFPKNSHLQTDFLFSMPSFTQTRSNLMTNWSYDLFHNYLLLAPGVDHVEFCNRAMPDMIAKNYKEALEARDSRDEFYLQPLLDIHLRSNIEYETEPPGNAKIINILFGFAIFLLIVAWINYINLTTALSIERAREIGIRKITGAVRFSLIGQFVAEAFIFNIASLLITLIIFAIFNPLFCSITNISDFNLFTQSGFVWVGLLVFLSGILLSSIYPALILSSYQPITVLKGKFKNSLQGIGFRKALTSVQFFISVVLLIGTLVAYRQALLLMNKNMGVDYRSSIVVRAPRNNDNLETRLNKISTLKNKFRELPEISDFTFTSDIPGEEITNFFSGRRKGFDVNDNKAYYQIAVDNRFIDFFQVKLLAGRKFFPDEKYEQRTILMNKLAADRFGYPNPEDAVGKVLARGNNQEWLVVGVVDDFHYRSVKLEAMPTVISLNDGPKLYMVLKTHGLQENSFSALITKLKKHYAEIYPDQPFEFFSLDDKMQLDLKPDKTFAMVFSLFSLLAIFIAVIGIVGLILITINQSIKALGVRKVLGAQRSDLSFLLSKQVQWQFFVATCTAIPLSYYGYKKWFLEGYLYRIDLAWWYFFIPVFLLVLTISSVIVILSIFISKKKTAEILRYE